MSNPQAGGLEPYIEPCPSCRGSSVRYCRTCKQPQDTCSHAGNYERRAVDDSATRNSAMIGNSCAKTYITKADALQAEVEALRTALRENWDWGHRQRDAFYGGSKAFELARDLLGVAPERDP